MLLGGLCRICQLTVFSAPREEGASPGHARQRQGWGDFLLPHSPTQGPRLQERIWRRANLYLGSSGKGQHHAGSAVAAAQGQGSRLHPYPSLSPPFQLRVSSLKELALPTTPFSQEGRDRLAGHRQDASGRRSSAKDLGPRRSAGSPHPAGASATGPYEPHAGTGTV